MLNSVWKRRAIAALPSEDLDVFSMVLARFQTDLQKGRIIWNELHIRTHFNDYTSYVVCDRYQDSFFAALRVELKSCVFVSVPVYGTAAGIENKSDTHEALCTDCARAVATTFFPRESWWDTSTDDKLRAIVSDKIVMLNTTTGRVIRAEPGSALLGGVGPKP